MKRKQKKRRAKIKAQRQKHLRLFVDPASISSGWALFQDSKLIAHGTVAVDKKDPVFTRLAGIFKQYKAITNRNIKEVHIEQLVRNTHIYTHWSVGVIGCACWLRNISVSADIPITSWQSFCDWKGSRQPLVSYKRKVESEDELSAIGMGLWYIEKHNIK